MTQLDEAAARLVDLLRGGQYGEVRVLRVTTDVRPDSDDVPSIFLTLLLSDPPNDVETWELEDVLSLRRAVLDGANTLGVEAPVYVELHPETDTVPEEEESGT